MKITDYPRITSIKPNNIFLIDGPDGTRGILASDLGFTADGAAIRPIPFTIPSAAWQASTVFPDFPFQAALTIVGVVPADLVRADFDLVSLIAASESGLAPAGNSITNGVIFFAQKAPIANLSGVYTIFKGVV